MSKVINRTEPPPPPSKASRKYPARRTRWQVLDAERVKKLMRSAIIASTKSTSASMTSSGILPMMQHAQPTRSHELLCGSTSQTLRGDTWRNIRCQQILWITTIGR